MKIYFCDYCNSVFRLDIFCQNKKYKNILGNHCPICTRQTITNIKKPNKKLKKIKEKFSNGVKVRSLSSNLKTRKGFTGEVLWF